MARGENTTLAGEGEDWDPDLEWAGLKDRVDQQGHVEASVAANLVGYFRDCAVATQRALNLRNVFEDRDAQVLAVGGDAWQLTTGDGLTLSGREAVNLALANQVNSLEKPLVLGALFIVGRFGHGPGRHRTYCAPLLVASVSQVSEATSATFMLEGDVGMNLSLLADLTEVDRDNEEEMFQRFESLIDQVPDAPLDVEDVEQFCLALRTALDLPFGIPKFTGFEHADLAAETALGGDLHLVPASALFIGKEAAELSVIRELDAVAQASLDGTALQALLEPEVLSEQADEAPGATLEGPAPLPDRPADWHDDIEVLELTDTQRRVVASARTERLTVVTGPPGTGKSYSIAAVVLDHLLARRRVLVTSGTPKAVEVVVSMLESIGGPFVVATSGDRAHQRELAKRIDQVTSPKGAPRWYPETQIEAQRQRYYSLRAELAVLEEQLIEVLAREGAMAFHLAAIKGVADIVNRFDLGALRRTTTDVKRLRERTLVEPDARWLKRWRARRALDALRKELRPTTEVKDGDYDQAIRYLDHRAELDQLAQALESSPDLVAAWEKLNELREELLRQGARVLAMQRQAELASLLDDQPSRLALRKFAQALRAARHKAKRELLEQVPIEVLLRAFPCWALTDRFLSHVLPLRPGLFDLGVIDEASQVDLAAAAPALYRSRRGLVVGDPHQLRFVSFLSAAAETAAFSRHDVPAAFQVTHRFSRRSLFDVAEDVVAQRSSLMLDEHFRSQPHIIRFSNREFYDQALRIMTERPHSDGARAVEVKYVGGRRDPAAARNLVEVSAAIDVVRTYVETAEGGGHARSIGILSPYRDQANAMSKAVAERLTPGQIARHKITCGTAHSLQGDERDIVVMSTVIDPGFNPNSLRFLEDPNVFNVAVTRAAERLIVISSVRPDQLPSGEHRYLKKFLLHAEDLADPEGLPDTFDSEFEAEVANALRERGHRIISHYPSCGYEIDLVATTGTASVAIECDGHPDHFRADGSYATKDIQRHVILVRAGWTVYHIPLSTWRVEPRKHLTAIEQLLEEAPKRTTRVPVALPEPLRGPARPPKPDHPVRKKGSPARAVRARDSAKQRETAKRGELSDTRCSCGGRWVLRNGRYGDFYGCSRFPRCRRTRSYR